MEPKYLKDWQKRLQKQRRHDRSKARLAKSTLPKAIEVLQRHGAKKIVLFGSLCEENRYRSHSDIDLAVEGIESRIFCRAYADLIMALNWPVDLKPLEELEKPFKERILAQGELLYEE